MIETIAEQQTSERARTFDPRASVRMLRYDIEHFGAVLDETRNQVCNEEISYLAEGVDRAARTDFAFKREGDEIVYFKDGKWRPYIGMLLTGQSVAHMEAEEDPRRQFLAVKADEDLIKGYQIQGLRPGQSMRWHSRYPYEVEALYGKEFMQARGMFPKRKMAFLYEASCQEDGSVILSSQTVDRSDDEALAAAVNADNMGDMVDNYDEVLGRKHGQEFYAGRLNSERDENAWEIIAAQHDLTQHLIEGLESIAHSDAEGLDLETRAKRHVYGVWAALKKRLDGEEPSYPTNTSNGLFAPRALVALEVQRAYREFVNLGKVLIGCGGEIKILKGEEDIMNASSEDVFDSIFGKDEEDKYGSLTFTCPKGHMNKRPRNKLIPRCKTCKTSVSCNQDE